MNEKILKTDEEWKRLLSEDEFKVCRKKGTERPFSGEYYDLKDEGIYRCRCCGAPLFSSSAKYDSGSGWPSFYRPASDNSILEEQDNSHGMSRTEIMCSRCEAHLGHVFPDGPQPTGLRYCVNSLSLDFEKKNENG